ncbi:MAG: biotin/lipoyl-binding protein [Planctomycetaceae bacterium]|nr:biotin/lipoyl-binding protein [Planctomycetaceae bacterium]
MTQFEHATFQLANARPRLREGIELQLQEYAGQSSYLLEDRVRGHCFRVGLSEAAFLAQLDGHNTVTQAIAETSRQLGTAAVDEQQATQLCHWLVEHELVESASTGAGERLAGWRKQHALRKRWELLNPVMLKIPLLNPDSLIRLLESGFGWLIGPWLAITWLVIALWGGMELLLNWPTFTATGQQILDQHNWQWLLITWTVLKLVHELAHAIVCRHYGGPVRSSGVLLLLLVPLPYVDVTSSWRFPYKWQRMLTAAAGMLVELFLAAVAAILFAHSESALLRQHAANVMVTASVVTILFNLNPLMRFDGYYLLSDWLELPNLSTRGRRWVFDRLNWLFLGKRLPAHGQTERSWLVPIYGVMSSGWTLLITASLTLGALNLLPGIGLLMAAIFLGLSLVRPLLQTTFRLTTGNSLQPAQKLRCLFVSFLLGYGCWSITGKLPAPSRTAFPAITEAQPLMPIRNVPAGFVEEVLVAQGDQVAAGQVLLRLRNRPLVTELKSHQIQLEQSRLRHRSYLQRGAVAAAAMEAETTESLAARCLELQGLLDQLVIRAPAAGRVLSSQLDEWAGQYTPPGTELLLLADPDQTEILASIPASEFPYLGTQELTGEWRAWGSYHVGHPVTVRMLEPRLSLLPIHAGLGAQLGGPLPVAPKTTQAGPQWQLLEPTASARFAFLSHDDVPHILGQRGQVLFRLHHGSLRDALFRWGDRWLRNRVHEWHGI